MSTTDFRLTFEQPIFELRDQIKLRVADSQDGMALLFQSFGFKNGVPSDADLVFDVRCLPNPHWISQLRHLTGLDQGVIEFLQSHPTVEEMVQHLAQFLETWLPRFAANNRSYMTVAIGCTGGQHRSVYITERLNRHFSDRFNNVQARHRDL